MINKQLILFIAVVILALVQLFAQTPDELLPKDNEVAGITLNRDSVCFTGLPKDSQSLYDLIDSGADKYLTRGFRAGAFAGFTFENDVICVSIFDQTTAEHALQVYHLFNAPKSFVNIPSLGDSACIDTTLPFNYEIGLLNANFFIRLSSTREDQQKEAMITLARRIVEKSLPIKNNSKHHVTKKEDQGSISEYLSNGNFLFKISANTRLFTDSENPYLAIYDTKGLLIKKLAIHSFSPQHYISHWDRKNEQGMYVSPGMYTAMISHQSILIRKSFVVGF